MYIGLFAVFVVAAIIAMLYLSSPTSSNPPPITNNFSIVVGVGTHGNLSSETESLESGVRYYRTDINLQSSQIAQLAWESKNYSAQYLGILDYETLPGGSANKMWNLSEWNASVANAVADYPEISTWEIWNEPWVSAFETGYMNGSAYNYYTVIKSAYTIIKAKDPNATVVCFGGAPISDTYTFIWYSQVWSYGAANYCNAISIHAYTGAYLLNQSGIAQQWTAGLAAYENLTHKPIWITETGIPSATQNGPQVYSQSFQNTFLAQDFSFFDSFPYVQRVYWYDLWGLSDAPTNNDYGLLNFSDPSSQVQPPAWQTFLAIYRRSASIAP